MTATTKAKPRSSHGGGESNGSPRPVESWEVDALARLCQWFGVEFHLFAGSTGELVHCAFDHRSRDWGTRGQLCRVVAERGTTELIEEEEPLVVLAIPIAGPRHTMVAVGTFVTTHIVPPNRLGAISELLGLEPADAGAWVARQ